MLSTGPVGVAFKTATTGVCAKMAADTKLTPTERAFVSEYATAIAAGNTSYHQDAEMKVIFDRWWIENMKDQSSNITV